MRLTKEQILKMAKAAQQNGAEEFYLEEDARGAVTFGTVETIITKKKKRIPLGHVHVGDDGS